MSTGVSGGETTFAVVGATGLVGRTMLQVLIERGLAGNVRALASGRSVGSELDDRWR